MYIDINKKYIPNSLNLALLILAFYIRGFNESIYCFIGSSVYSLPILLLYGYVSDYLKKEIIGFGDLKLIVALGGLLYVETINLFLQIYIFYLITFGVASLFILFLFIYNLTLKKKHKLKNKEIPFAPFICISFFILYNRFSLILGYFS